MKYKGFKLLVGFTLLSVILIKVLFPFYFDHIFDYVPAERGAETVRELHMGDQLQQYYLSWVQHQNLSRGTSLFHDPFLFSVEGESFLDMEMTPLYMMTAVLGFVMPLHVAFNMSYTLLPLVLVGIFTFLFLSLFTRFRALALFGALLFMIYPYRIENQLLGHHAGAYAFFFPLLLWQLETTYRHGITRSRWFLFILLLPLSAVSELHIGYYCVLLAGLWLGCRIGVLFWQEGWSQARKRLMTFIPLIIGVFLTGVYGWGVRHFVLNSTGVLPIRSSYEIAHYSFPLFSTFFKPHGNLGYPIIFAFFGLCVFLIVHVVRKRRALSPQFDFKESVGSFLTYLFLLLFFVIAAAGTKGIESFYLFLYKILPGFSMQRVPHKMAYVAYTLWCLAGVILWSNLFEEVLKFKQRSQLIFRSLIGAFILVFAFQLFKIEKAVSTFSLHDPKSDVFSDLHEFIKANVPESEILVRLPLENGQQAQDGYAFFHILKTNRRFFNGYHGAPPKHYLEIQDDLSKIYDGSASYMSFQFALNRGIRWFVMDLRPHPDVASKTLKAYQHLPFLTLKFQNNTHALFYLERALEQEDIILLNKHKPSAFLEGWSALSSLAGHPGHWMKQEKRDDSQGIISVYAHKIKTPLSRSYKVKVHYKTTVPLTVSMAAGQNKVNLENQPNQDLIAEIILPKGLISPTVSLIAKDLFIPSKLGHSDPNHYGFFIHSIEIHPSP
jgi:hypothetical protein